MWPVCFNALWHMLLQSHYHSYSELNTSIDALVEVNATVVDLVMLTQRLQTELDDITNQTTELNMACINASSSNPALNSTVCDAIPTTSYNVIIDYSAVSILLECACLYVCVCILCVWQE